MVTPAGALLGMWVASLSWGGAGQPARPDRVGWVAQVTMPDLPPAEPVGEPAPQEEKPAAKEEAAAGPVGVEGGSGRVRGDSGEAVAAKPATPAGPEKPREKWLRLSFGLQLGQPLGLQAEARLLRRHALVTSVGWDFLYRSLTFAADYRFTFLEWDSLTYDLTLGFFAGGGVRLGTFEPVRPYRRETPFSAGLRFPLGTTLELRPLPVQFGLWVSPLSFDVKEVALALPRWRPEAGLEIRVVFPHSPF